MASSAKGDHMRGRASWNSIQAIRASVPNEQSLILEYQSLFMLEISLFMLEISLFFSLGNLPVSP